MSKLNNTGNQEQIEKIKADKPKLFREVSDNDGEGDGNHEAQDNPQRVVADGVADHVQAFAGEEELEVLQPDPGTLQQVHREGDFPRRQLVVQEGHHDTAHGKVADQQQPDRDRNHHGREPERLASGPAPAQGDRLIDRHKRTTFPIW